MDPKIVEIKDLLSEWSAAVVYKFRRIVEIAKKLGVFVSESLQVRVGDLVVSIRGDGVVFSCPKEDWTSSPYQFVTAVNVDPLLFVDISKQVDEYLDAMEKKIKERPGKMVACLDEARRIVAGYRLDQAADPAPGTERR